MTSCFGASTLAGLTGSLFFSSCLGFAGALTSVGFTSSVLTSAFLGSSFLGLASALGFSSFGAFISLIFPRIVRPRLGFSSSAFGSWTSLFGSSLGLSSRRARIRLPTPSPDSFTNALLSNWFTSAYSKRVLGVGSFSPSIPRLVISSCTELTPTPSSLAKSINFIFDILFLL